MSSSEDRILVLGATGRTGSETAKSLVAAGHRPRLLVRPASRAKLADLESVTDVREGDLEDQDTVPAALEGIERLFLVSTAYTGRTDGRILEQRTLETAKRAGVRHVVKLSTFRADDPNLLLGRWHKETEDRLKASGMDWTILRPSNFNATALLMWAPSIRAKGIVMQASAAGRNASIDTRDIGDIAAAALTGSTHASKTYTLTGPASYNAAEYVQMIAEARGAPVQIMDIPEEAMRQALASYGLPQEHITAALEVMASVKAGEWDFVSQDVETVLGRPARTFQDWVRDNVSAFRHEGG